MNDKIVVSVAMVTYNHGEYIKVALDSILKQKTNYKYEIVIGDDCSPDNTVSILRGYQARYPNIIVLIDREKNIGPTKNLYDVLLKCRGSYIAFLEGDDFYTDELKLQKQVEFLEKNPNCKSCAHRIEIVDKNGQHIFNTLSDIKLNKYMGELYFKKYGTDMLHLNSLMFVNMFLNSGDKYDIIYKSNRYACHSLMLLLLLQQSDIYVFEEAMSAWRKVIEDNATNYTSLARKRPLEIMLEKIQLYYNEKIYFKDSFKEIKFSKLLSNYYVDALIMLVKSNSTNKMYYLKEYSKFLTIFEKLDAIAILLFKKPILRILRLAKQVNYQLRILILKLI